jgi:two-component system, cell cycle sensor histidine kinase and response regulator CckA
MENKAIPGKSELNEALQASETIHQNFIQFSPMGIHQYSLKPDGRLIFVGANPAADKILGVDHSIFINKTIEDAFPPLVATEVPTRYREVAQTGVTWQTEQIDYNDGKIRGAFQVVAFQVKENNMAAMFLDITERKRTEQGLIETTAQIRSVFEQSPIGTVFVDMDKRFIRCNPAFCRFLGYKENELIGRTIASVTYPEDVDIGMNELKQIAEDKLESYIAQKRYQRKDGAIVWGEVSISVVRDATNKPLYFLPVIKDITARKLDEEALRKSEERFRAIFNSTFQFTGLLTLDGILIEANKAALDFAGITAEEIIDKPFWETPWWSGNETRVHQLRDAISRAKQGAFVRYEVELQGAGAATAIIDFSLKPVYNAQGNVILLVPEGRDITFLNRMKDELQRTQKLESLGILAGGIAHDFNNLMGGIYGYIDLANGCSKDENVSGYLEKALATISRARGLTQQLLTFAKGGAPIQKVGPMFPCVKDAAEFALSGSNVSCRFKIPKDIWQCNFDKNQISQVIDNIVINAQQAMPGGGVIELTARNITLGASDHLTLGKGDYVRISIKDHGIGISNELLSRIFDPFFTTKTKGHGLGLATCYSIINRHGGAIDVESDLGKGSTFHVFLPAVNEFAMNEASPAAVRHKGSGTIIIMDDEEALRDSIGNMLKAFGYSPRYTNNGKEALDLFIGESKAQSSIAALILDLTIPGGMGGKEIIKEIRKLNSVIPVFVASGYADNPVMQNPSKHGFTASICKPFTMKELAGMLSKYLIDK